MSDDAFEFGHSLDQLSLLETIKKDKLKDVPSLFYEQEEGNEPKDLALQVIVDENLVNFAFLYLSEIDKMFSLRE
jgi:hypothetical protein